MVPNVLPASTILDDVLAAGIYQPMKDRKVTTIQGRENQLFDFRRELARTKRRRQATVAKMIASGLTIGVLLGLTLVAWPRISAAFPTWPSSPQFTVCGAFERSCVIDGDTFRLDGVKIRIADIDTPELKGRCQWEIRKAEEARDRLAVLLSEGSFVVEQIGDRDEDRYGRKLRAVMRNGSSLGDQLVSEGLARTWTGRREPWC